MTKQNKPKITNDAEDQKIVFDLTTLDKETSGLYKKHLARLKRTPPKFKITKEESSGKPTLGYDDTNNPALTYFKTIEALGTVDPGLQSFLINQLLNVFEGFPTADGWNFDQIEEFLSNAMAILTGINPRDEVEGLLAVQMVGVHNAAMMTLKRVMIKEQTIEGKEANVNHATKMLRTFTAQMEALKRYRTGGQQKVIVEHVNVHPGGQAIVGTVTQGGGVNEGK